MAQLYLTIPSIDDGEYIDLDNYESGEDILIYAKNKARKWAKMNGIPYEDPIFTDVNDIPDSLYEEDMDEAALDRLLEAYKASEEKGLPFEVIADIIREYDPSDLEDWIDEKYEGQFSSDTELGEHWIDGVYGGVDKLDKDTLERYFDYESYGSDLAYDYNVYDGYYFRSYKKGGLIVKPKAKKKKETTREAFEKLVKKVAEYYVGKPVKKEYQDKYGKTYDEKEAKQVGYAVATKVLGRPKFANGGLFNDDSEEAYQSGKGVYWHYPFHSYEMNGVFYIYYKDIDDIQYITPAKDIKEAKWMVNALEFGYAMGRDELKKATMVFDNDTYYIKIGIFREKLGKNKMVADKKYELFERGASLKKPKISLSDGGEIKVIPYHRTAFGGSMKEMTALLTQNLEEAKDYINNAIGDKDRFYIMVLEPISGAKLYKVVENITKR